MTGTPEVLRERAEHHAKEAERLDACGRHPALVDFAHCVRAWGGLVARGQLRSPREYVGGLRRDTFLCDPRAAPSDGADGWWRIEPPVEAAQPA